MAIPDQIQMLGAAFAFGLLLQAAFAALLLYLKGHISTIFRERRRLVLILFLKSVAMWAQFGFTNFMVPQTSPNVCQIMIIISTFFDQAARVTIGGFLLWSVGRVTKSSTESYSLGTLVGIRVIVGGIFIAYTRPQFAPVCVARSDLLLASITVMTLDVVIIGVLTIRVFTLGLLRSIREVRSSTKQEQSKALVYCTVGFFIWTLTSIIMLLGMESMILLLRTAVPTAGLMVLVTIVTIYPGALLLPREEDLGTPEAYSPFVTRSSRSLGSLGDNNGASVTSDGHTETSNPFVVNPSNAPGDLPSVVYQGGIKAHDTGYIKYSRAAIRAVDVDNAGFSMPRDAVGNRGSSGMFHSVLAAPLGVSSSAVVSAPTGQVAHFPLTTAIAIDQTRAIPTQNVSTADAHQKRSLFWWSKKSANQNVRKIVISKPVMNDIESSSPQPFARMRTVDLATAAATERERREGTANRQLIAKRPAPLPPTISAAEALQRSISTKRKEMPRGWHAPMKSTASSKSSSNVSGLPVDANASSTSASLSPAQEEVRRRSPRILQSLFRDFEKLDFLEPQMQNSNSGFPLYPRQQPLHANGVNQQTVMYVNDIVYDDPDMVKSIINGAPATMIESKLLWPGSPKSTKSSTSSHADSILHRPRPYRRVSEKDRVLFPSEPSPRHKRGKSNTSIISKKSILQSRAGSSPDLPTLPALPALPQLPTSAARLERLLPNDTRSMTVDEKIPLLFPAPPGEQRIHNRRSSVPSLPRIPSSILLSDSIGEILKEQDLQNSRTSERSTTSFGVPPVNEGITPIAETPIINESDTYRFSANTYRTLAEVPRDSWVQEEIANVPGTENSEMDGRLSLPSNGPRKPAVTEPSSNADGSHDDSKSGWASPHSLVPVVRVTTAQQTARETYIQMRKETQTNMGPLTELSALSPTDVDETQVNGDGEGLMTVMLGLGEINFTPAANRQSFMDGSQVLPKDKLFSSQSGQTWHRRIGDELPAFSERRKHLRSRTMPPPMPLLLSTTGRQATVIVRKPQPSPAIDGPEKVIKEIQDQLRKFEEPSRESLGILIGQMPYDSSKSSAEANSDRLGLLENLENEMGLQETHWMRMHHNFDRDSNSVTMSPQVPEAGTRPLLSPPSEASSRRTSRSVVRRPRIRSNMTAQSMRRKSTSTLSTQSSNSSRASVWQQRLAEAQIEFMENTSALLDKVNFLSISKTQLGSPTPPDSLYSDSDSETDIDDDTDEESYDNEPSGNTGLAVVEPKRQALWEPKYPAPTVKVGHMWSPPRQSSSVRAASPEPAALSLRPAKRRDHNPLLVASSTLWSKPATRTNRPVVGLWGSRMTRPKSIITRPKTQKPQRKSKRVTFLPDILESPSPLPHKHDMLGIFRFPWGEKSDSAVYDPIPVPNPAGLYDFVLNPSLEAKSRQLEPQLTEYSSSFFDDYDEDYDEESEDNSDNDFDETTLSQIANLLNSKDVPSKNSLLPPPRIIEDYDDEDDSEPELSEGASGSSQPTQTTAIPAMVKWVSIEPLKPVTSKDAPLWNDTNEATLPIKGIGLPQPVSQVWEADIPSLDNAVRFKSGEPSSQASLSKINSKKLWDKAIGAVSSLPVEKAVTLWTQPSSGTGNASRLRIDDGSSTEKVPQTKLWAGRQTQAIKEDVGLFAAGIHHTDYHTSHQVSAAIETIRKPRIDTNPLPALESQQLWSPSKNSSSEHHWISESSVRVASPSVYSISSSGRSSPASGRFSPESDIASVTSTSTKASSLWSPDAASAVERTTIPIWRKSKAVEKATLPVPDAEKSQFNDPVTQSSKRPLAPLRQSTVLASRALWESKALILDANPTKKTWSSKITAPNVSREKKPRMRNAATAAQWDAALMEAISRGRSRTQRSVASMSDWETALSEAIPQCPLQTHGENTADASAKYDPAVLHPVFFTSFLVSRADSVHPAATGHVIYAASGNLEMRKPNHLWTAPSLSASQISRSSQLWTAKIVPALDRLSILAQHSRDTGVRKAKAVPTSLLLNSLSSTSLWRPSTSTISAAKHWLHATTHREVSTSPTAKEHRPLPMVLSSLEQSSSTKESQNPTNPISPHKSNPSASAFPASGRRSIWTAPTRSNTVSGHKTHSGSSLWMPAEPKAPEETSEVPSAPHVSTPKRTSASRPTSRQLNVEKVESTELWRPKWGLPESPKEWLRVRSASRVEFRY